MSFAVLIALSSASRYPLLPQWDKARGVSLWQTTPMRRKENQALVLTIVALIAVAERRMHWAGLGSRCRPRRHGLLGSRRLAHPCPTGELADPVYLTGLKHHFHAGGAETCSHVHAVPTGVALRGPYAPLAEIGPPTGLAVRADPYLHV